MCFTLEKCYKINIQKIKLSKNLVYAIVLVIIVVMDWKI